MLHAPIDHEFFSRSETCVYSSTQSCDCSSLVRYSSVEPDFELPRVTLQDWPLLHWATHARETAKVVQETEKRFNLQPNHCNTTRRKPHARQRGALHHTYSISTNHNYSGPVQAVFSKYPAHLRRHCLRVERVLCCTNVRVKSLGLMQLVIMYIGEPLVNTIDRIRQQQQRQQQRQRSGGASRQPLRPDVREL